MPKRRGRTPRRTPRGDAQATSQPGAPSNQDIAQALEDYAETRANAGGNPYRARAYLQAARAVAAHPEPLALMVAEGRDVQAVPGVGPSIAKAIREVVATGLISGTGSQLETLDLSWEPPPAGRRPPGGQLALRGDLHTHTHATDGRDSILQMAVAARRLGYEYIAITDHSKETRVAGGLDEVRMRAHVQRIRRADEAIEGITVLCGAEVDIRRDGSLDFPDDLLGDLDVVVCSVHFRHKLSGSEQTDRILKGMSNEHACILGHPTGRRRGIRPGMHIDVEAITDAARDQGWAIEMNGSPERMDLDATAAALAASKGVLLALDSDAHSTRELANITNCQREARKAGLSRGDVLNTKGLAGLRKALRR